MSGGWKFNPPPPPLHPNADWLLKYAPKTPPPDSPQTIAAAIPQGGLDDVQVEAAILEYNNNLSQWVNNPLVEWTDAIKGVVIHKIDLATAATISTRVKPAAAQYQLPLTFVLGCLAIESTLDPTCQNGNLGPGESNTANDPLGYDMGVAQFKLRYLVGYAPGVTDASSANAFALDADKAIPYFCSLMASKVIWATNVIQENTSSSPDSRLNNPLLLATGAYNFGEEGMLVYYENGSFPSHCQQVLDLERYFAEKLGVASVFSALTS